MEEKKVARMGLAIVNESTCLPFAGREDCDLCVQECQAAGYDAIEYIQVGTQVDPQGTPIDGTGMLAPRVIAKKCVGCGLCQTRCYGINVKESSKLEKSAIIVESGPGREDRLMTGSYQELRQQREASERKVSLLETLPGFEDSPPPIDEMKSTEQTKSLDQTNPIDETNPFGL